MDWLLVNEIGIEYATPSGDRGDEELHMPVAAARADDGTYLIVDELGYDRPLGEPTQCRTIRVSADGDILYDSTACGIWDAFGCLIDGGLTAVLSRSSWEILIIGDSGSIVQRIGLWTFSKRFPRSLFWTGNGTFLVSFLDGLGQFDVVEIDPAGRLLWYLPSHDSVFRFPVGMQTLPNGNVLLADGPSHIVAEIDRSAAIAWQCGEWRVPAGTDRHLSLPGSLRQMPDGRKLVADTRNHRVLIFDTNGTVSQIRLRDDDFCDPTFADHLDGGSYLICDSSNARVVEVDAAGNKVWQYGGQTGKRRQLSYPRSVEAGEDGHLLISDTAHNRIVEVAGARFTPWPALEGDALFWPRSAKRLPSGSALIADGRNSRVIEVSTSGEVLRQLDRLDIGAGLEFGDPHDATQLPNGNLLITDSSQNIVVETDWSGKVHWLIGRDNIIALADPHTAQLLPDGRVLISDSGHNRIVVVDPHGGSVHIRKELFSGSSCYRLDTPKHAHVFDDTTLIVVDTGNSRILAADVSGELFWELSSVPQSPIPLLHYPRWAHLVNHDELFVCDHYHHRILHFKKASTR